MRYGVVWDVAWYGVVWCCVMCEIWYGMVWCGVAISLDRLQSSVEDVSQCDKNVLIFIHSLFLIRAILPMKNY